MCITQFDVGHHVACILASQLKMCTKQTPQQGLSNDDCIYMYICKILNFQSFSIKYDQFTFIRMESISVKRMYVQHISDGNSPDKRCAINLLKASSTSGLRLRVFVLEGA